MGISLDTDVVGNSVGASPSLGRFYVDAGTGLWNCTGTSRLITPFYDFLLWLR